MPYLHKIETLEREDRIAKGAERHVFQMAEMPDLLLKVLRKKHLRKLNLTDDRRFRSWLRIRRTYALYLREQRAYTDAMLRAAVRGVLPPLASVGDFVVTPSGLGQMVERVMTADGQTAPTLEDLLSPGPLPNDRLDALNRFVKDLYTWHIPAYDLGPKNIVWNGSQDRFVLVDGFGDRSVLPLKTWIRMLNDRRLDRAFSETATKCDLVWNRLRRQFRNSEGG